MSQVTPEGVAPGGRWWHDIRPDQWRTLTGAWAGWVLDALRPVND